MNCKEFEEISGAYALDAVTPEEQEAAQAHLAQCPTCTFLLKELRSAVALLALAAPPVDPPESLKARIMSAIQQEKADITTTAAQSTPQVQTVQHTRRPRLVTQLLAAAALLLLVLFGGMSAWNISLKHQLAGTQQQLANMIGAQRHTVSRWETGENEARGANLKALQELQKKAEEKTK